MPVNRVAENVLGTMGTICWAIQMIPQIWKSYRTKNTDGLSDWMILSWAIAGAFLGAYAVIQDINIPLILQPQMFSALGTISWAQCLYYGRKFSLITSILACLGVMAFVGGFETAMIFAAKPAYEAGRTSGKAAVEFYGIFTSVIIALALLPQYYEVWYHKEVVGISMTFMLIDALGGLFSDLSLVFKPEFDVIAGVTYTIVVVMDSVIIVAALILNPRARKRRLRLSSEANTPSRRGSLNTGPPNSDTERTVVSSPITEEVKV
ncbi:hypothetical protein K435DRAFT_731718 [Dendrothele bispora CBS 962.96]|uniref:PQ-loop-domain-containing protein n=1 Tax=Dendrothele bispora (strain CBS 962.96) TaxID=1314807 RepID=A0A4S8LBN0_DENBC|nr:hypothetical protein K435DRAFT_731718 [Dendrothele bispora CBS 962.96]